MWKRWLALHPIVRVVLSAIAAVLIMGEVSAVGDFDGTSTSLTCSPWCNGGGGGGSPTPTATPDYTWVEDLPALGQSPTQYALFSVCEAGSPGLCFPFNYSYWDHTAASAVPFDPCCMGASILQLWWQAVVSNGGANSAYTPDIEVNGTVYSLYSSLGTFLIDPDCSTISTAYPVEKVGCVNVRIQVDGANEIDHVTLFGDSDLIPISGFTFDYRHKFE